MSRSRRVAVAVLAAATVAACAWLLTARSPSMSALDVPASETSAAVSALQRQGIPAEIREGRLVVPADHLTRARTVLRDGSSVTAAFEKLSTASDIWSTQEQQDKRWQAAKMVALGRLIEEFDNIRTASVLLEVGKGRSLGKSSPGASASVHVVTADQKPLRAELVQAIGELVCGSVAGLEAADVHIVDSTGQSYRALGREAMAQQEQIQKHRLMQEQWSRRILASLPDGAVTAVSVQLSEGPSPRPTAVRLLVPSERSAAESVASLLRWTAQAAGLDERAVSCDVAAAADVPLSSAAPQDESLLASWSPWIWAGPLAGFVLGLAAMAWFRPRRAAAQRRAGVLATAKRSEDGPPMQAPPQSQDVPTEEPQEKLQIENPSSPTPLHGRDAHATHGLEARATTPYRRLAMFAHLAETELVKLLADEHPQTVAIVLAHLPPEKAAVVLAHLPGEQQAQVARRVANLDRPGDDILCQIERGLIQRLTGSATPAPASPGGPAAVVAILRHTDTALCKAVLRELDTDAPHVADAVRQRLTDFAELDTELAAMPAASLAAALADMETRDMALALCAAPEAVSRRVLGALDSSRARAVRAAMGNLGPMRLADVEAAQESLAAAVRRAGSGVYASTRPAETATVAAEGDVWRE